MSMDSQTNESILLNVEYSFGGANVSQDLLGWGDGDLARLAKIKELI